MVWRISFLKNWNLWILKLRKSTNKKRRRNVAFVYNHTHICRFWVCFIWTAHMSVLRSNNMKLVLISQLRNILMKWQLSLIRWNTTMNRRFILRYMIYGIIVIILIQFIFLFNVFSDFSVNSSESKQQVVNEYRCEINDKQAKSALKRIKTDSCRKQVIDTYCDLHNGASWNWRLSPRCPNFGEWSFPNLWSFLFF